ncbi:MAG: SDR family oxidoreductase [Chloroflexi bacterium]|nr:SDR family oxidoreductase [Chloroflexota bacterium]
MNVLKQFDLSGKVAVVTGGARGLGRQAALALAEAGADVAICGRSTDGTPTATEIEAMGRRSFFAKVDVTKSAEIEPFVEEVIGRLGKIDILVNNAAIGTRGQSLETVSDAEWHEFMDGIMNCMFYVAKPIARHMIARGEGGVIINMTSINAFIISNIAPRYNVPYCVAKAGVAHMTHGMATNWAPHKIRVNGIAPGFIPTEISSALLQNPDIMNRMLAGQPMGRFGQLEEIKGAILFLASDASSYMTGHNLVMDGGATLW